MCGIAGLVDRSGAPLEEERLRAIAASLSHRGPDDEGVVALDNVGLVHRRLSIIDPSPAGHQPMFNADETAWIVFNGEIYNFEDIRKELPPEKPYRSGTDTEVLLRAFEEWGPECLHRLNGMFAFAAVDRVNQRLLLARDRFGIKPLYYAEHGNGFSFSSEVKGLIAAGLPPETDTMGAVEWVYYGLPPNHRNMFRDVKRLAPGHYLLMDLSTGEYEIQEYYSPKPDWSYLDKFGDDEKKWLDIVDEMLQDAVRTRMVSDVPLGTYCSGGIDSSLITAMAAKEQSGLTAFAVAMPDHPERDEGPAAREVAEHLGVGLSTFDLTKESFCRALVQTVYITEYPLSFVNSVPLYLISQLARDQGVRVLLSGEGADEQFGGYIRQFRPLAIRRVMRAKGPVVDWLFNRAMRVLNPVNRRLGLGTFPPGRGGVALHRALAGDIMHRRKRDGIEKYFEPIKDDLDLELVSYLLYSLHSYLLPILHRTDRATMAASVEARVPFLDHRLVEMVQAIPPRYRVSTTGIRPIGKHILKKVALRYLPERTVFRQKVGFEVPVEYYSDAWPDGWIHEGFIQETFDVRPDDLIWWLDGTQDQTRAWMLTLEIWGQLFMRGRSVADVTEEYLKACGISAPV